DEAYRSYVEPAGRPDSSRLIAEHPNLLVQRTFSKSYALASLRLGYGLGSPEVIAAIAGIRPPFSVNVAAIAAGEAALARPRWRDYSVGQRPRVSRLDPHLDRRATRDGAGPPRAEGAHSMSDLKGMQVAREGDVYRVRRESREALVQTAVDFGPRRDPRLETTLAFFDHML